LSPVYLSPVYLSPVYLSPVYLSPVYLLPVCIDALRATTQPTCGPFTDLLLNRTRRLVYTAPLSQSPSDRSPSDSATPDSPVTHGVCEPTRASVFAHHTAPKTPEEFTQPFHPLSKAKPRIPHPFG